MNTTTTRLLTVAEFAALPDPPDGSKQELVRGEIVTMPPPGFNHGIVQTNIAMYLSVFAKQSRLGRVTTESGIVTETDPDSVRGPDVAFWSFERVPRGANPVPYPDAAADVAVEVLSPGNRPRQMTVKVREYLAAGVRLVWVIDPDARTVTAFTAADAGVTLGIADDLTGGDVLPGFRVPVADLFE